MAKTTKISLDDAVLLRAALEGLQLQRQRIDDQIAEIKSRLDRGKGQSSPAGAKVGRTRKPKKRTLSEAARERIRQAQKTRWAQYRRKKSASKAT